MTLPLHHHDDDLTLSQAIFFRVSDRLRLEGYVAGLTQSGMSLSMVSSQDAILDHYGKLLVARLREAGQTLSIVESFTGGSIAARLAPLPGAEAVFKRGLVTREASGEVSREGAAASAAHIKAESGASHALAVLMQLDEGADRPDFGATICIGVAGIEGTVSREARMIGGRDWVRVGAAELGLDCLRRYLLGLPVDERIDFERR